MTTPYTPPDPSVSFAPPSGIDFNAQMGVGSDIDRQEWELRKQRINDLITNIKARQDLAAHLAGGPYQGFPHKAQETADQLVNRATPPADDVNFDYGLQNKLYGAAQYYGISGYDKIPLPQLQQIINAKRLGVQQTHEGDLPFGEGVKAAGVGVAEGAANAFLGTTESLWGLAQKVPFLKDVLAERSDYDKVSQKLAKFTESVKADMSPEQAQRYQTVVGAGDTIGQSIIAWPLWELAGAVGGAPGLATYGARMSPIARATMQGATVAELMRGGGPGSGEQRGNEVAAGGAFAGALTALAPVIGAVAERLKKSFPVKDVGADNSGGGGGAPGTVDADWWFEGPDVASGTPAPGLPPAPSGPAGALPSGQYEMPSNSAVELGQGHTTEQLGEQAVFQRVANERRGMLRPSPESLSPADRQDRIQQLLHEQLRLQYTSLAQTTPEQAGIFAARADRLAKEVEALQQAGKNPQAEAAAYAQDFTKQATILESPAIQDMARQPNFDDVDVARAAAATAPSAAHVIQSVGDEGTIMQKFAGMDLFPRYIRFIQRSIPEEAGAFRRTDMLISNGKPITDDMATDYQQYGMFRGQTVTHGPAGVEGELIDVNPVRSTIRAGGADFIVPTADVLPGRSGPAAEPHELGIRNAPELYENFKKSVLGEFQTEAERAGIGPKDWLSPEVASVLPRRMSEFFDQEGMSSVERHAMDAYFNKQRVLDYQLAAPDAFAEMHAALGKVMDAVNAEPIATGFDAEINNPPSVYELADTKNYVWQHHPGQRSGVLLDLHSGSAIPMDHEGAAVEFLKGVNRELPDHTPISDVPAEVGEVGPYASNPGRTTEGELASEDIIGSYLEHEDNLEEELGHITAMDASAAVPTHPGVVNDPVLSLPPRAPVPPAGSPPLPPDQPPSPSSASGFGPDDPRLRGAQPESLGFQFARAQRVQPKTLEEVGNRFDSIVMRFGNPMRSLTLRATPWLEKMGINARNLWADGQALYEGRMRSHNDAHPYLAEASGIYNKFRRLYVRNGTVAKVAEIADYNQRIAEMHRLGYTPEEMSAQNQVEDLHNRFFDKEMVGQMGFNPHQRIFGYMSRVRARQANPRFTGDAYKDEEGHLGPFDWYAQHARTGQLDFREMNAERLTDHMVRAAMFEKHLAPTWNAMREAWSDQRIPSKFQDVVLNWLDVVRGGYNPKYQVGIQGVRQTLNTVGIPATDRDVQQMWNFVFKNFYRSGLGFKPAAFFRDSIQPLFAWTRYGNFPELSGVYQDILTNPTARQAMLDRGYKGGWIEKGRVRAAVSEAFDPVRNPEGVDLTNNQFREGVNQVVDYIHDRLPDRFKGGIQGTYADPMYLYGQKLGTLNRLVTGETGYRVASGAIARYRAGGLSMAELMDQSGARRSMPAIRDQFQKLAAQGHDEEAANLIAHEWADTQFRGGIAENPMGIRSLAGRAASMYGNFTVGYINQMKEGLSTGTVGDRIRFAMRQAAIAYAIGEAEKRSKWKGFSNWQWYSSLAFAGGPLATGALGFNQLISGGITRLMDQQPSPQQTDALKGAFGPDSPKQNPNNTFPMSVNPYRGVFETAQGLYGASQGDNPAEDAARFLLTNDRKGQGAGPAFERWWESLPEIAPNRPQLDPAFGRPMALNASASLLGASTPPQMALNPPDSTSGENGARPGETYEQYRRRVLARTTWSPDTAAHSNLRALRPEIREPLTAMMKAAADEGVQLQVSEAGRTQERQEMLFQKGRSQPGPQVTWTLNSDHQHGRAADLVSPTPQGYLWIQRNAARFGLHTLGASDPGHVFVPANSQVSGGIQSFIDSVLRAPAGSVGAGGGAHQ